MFDGEPVLVLCLELAAVDLHMVQLMPLPPRHLFFSEWFILLIPACPGCPRKKAVNRLCMCVCCCRRGASDPWLQCGCLLHVCVCVCVCVCVVDMVLVIRGCSVDVCCMCVCVGVDVVLVIRGCSVDVYCNPVNYVHLLPLIAPWRHLHVHCLPDTLVTTLCLSCLSVRLSISLSVYWYSLLFITACLGHWLLRAVFSRNNTPQNFMHTCYEIFCFQCFDAVGWVSGRASGP